MFLVFILLGGLEEQPFESWPNTTAANTSNEEARKGNNVRPYQVFGGFFIAVINFT